MSKLTAKLADRKKITAFKKESKEMSKTKEENKNLCAGGNGTDKPNAETLPNNQKESKAYKSAMKPLR